MIHIATVHYQTDKWIDLQLDYIKKNIKQPFRVYAFLCGEATKHRDKFFYSSVELIKKHSIKLNLLADIISFASQDPNDIIVFIDGDAFPVAPLDDFIDKSLKDYPMAAIQRVENMHELQPHPSFCVTTVSFWKEIMGDWSRGYEWVSSKGYSVSGVGGNLLEILTKRNADWLKLRRTLSIHNHSVFYGVYEDLIYHHGAGFHEQLTKCDWIESIEHVYKWRFMAKLITLFVSPLSIKNRYRAYRFLGVTKRLKNYNYLISEQIYNRIQGGDCCISNNQ